MYGDPEITARCHYSIQEGFMKPATSHEKSDFDHN